MTKTLDAKYAEYTEDYEKLKTENDKLKGQIDALQRVEYDKNQVIENQRKTIELLGNIIVQGLRG